MKAAVAECLQVLCCCRQFGAGCSDGVFTGVVLLSAVWCRLQWRSVYRCCVVVGSLVKAAVMECLQLLCCCWLFGVGCSGGVFTGVVLLSAVWCRVQWWSVYRCCCWQFGAGCSYYYYYRVLRAICCQPVDGSLICFM